MSKFLRRLDGALTGLFVETDLTKDLVPSPKSTPDTKNDILASTGDQKQVTDADQKQGIGDKTNEVDQQQKNKAVAAGNDDVNQDKWGPLLQRYNQLQAEAEKAQATARQTNASKDLEDALGKGQMAQQAAEAYKKVRWPKGAQEVPGSL